MSDKTSTSGVDLESNMTHRLSSVHPGESEVEQIAERIERRRAERIPVTFQSRVRFLKDCQKIALAKGYDTVKISLHDLKDYRNIVLVEQENRKGLLNNGVMRAIGVMADVDCLVEMLNRAVDRTENSDLDDNWFYYKDFSFENTRIVSRWPWLRTELRAAALVVFLYYFFSCILFCSILSESNVCQGGLYSYQGWVSTLYFASTTMSTVGYGDLTVSQDPRWRSFIGSAYMIVSVVVAVVAFSAAASSALHPLENAFEKIFDRFGGEESSKDFLYKRIRRVKFTRIAELTVQTFTFILIGVVASQIAVHYETNTDAKWTWMTSFYWAVQTTTTIGYGDLTQPFGLRWFKIVYLMFATTFVGNALGKLGSLKRELSEVRKRHAWDRRRVTRRFVDELQAYDNDDQVDQYEFLVASLISLGKLTANDISPIMDKFRNLAGDKGFISVTYDIEDERIEEQSETLEEDEIDQEE